MNELLIKKLPIRILICGLGQQGSRWLKNIRENKDYELVGVVEKNLDTLDAAKENHNIPENICFNDIKKAINSTKTDAVVVAVSPDKHGEIIRVAIKNNIHILSEKPLAKDINEAKEFLYLHKKYRRVKFVISQNYRGRECIVLMKDIIKSGTIGELGFFVYSHQQTVKIPGYRLEIESPILDDMAIHHFDLMRYLTDKNFIEIYANQETVSWSWFKGRPILYAIIKMSNFLSGIYCASWVSEGKISNWNGNIQIYGSNGCIELNDEGKVFLYGKHELDELLRGTYAPGEEIKPFNIKYSELQYSLENFKNSLTKDIKCETDIEDNIKSFAGVIAAKESIKSRKPITIESLGILS